MSKRKRGETAAIGRGSPSKSWNGPAVREPASISGEPAIRWWLASRSGSTDRLLASRVKPAVSIVLPKKSLVVAVTETAAPASTPIAQPVTRVFTSTRFEKLAIAVLLPSPRSVQFAIVIGLLGKLSMASAEPPSREKLEFATRAGVASTRMALPWPVARARLPSKRTPSISSAVAPLA